MLKLCGKFIEKWRVCRKLHHALVPAGRGSLETSQPSCDPLAQAERRGSQSGHAGGEWLCVCALPQR